MTCWIDSHNHLHDERLRATRAEWWPEMKREGIIGAVVNGTSPEDWPELASLRRSQPDFIFPSYGLHPWMVGSASSGWKSDLQRLLDSEPAVGIGEIGLDKWIRNPDLPAQKEAFAWQWNLARERELPVTVHCLQAWGHLLDILRNLPSLGRGFLLHSFAGPAQMIPELIQLGAQFSFSGHLMHPRKLAQAQAFIDDVPRDRLHLETDAPDMLPPQFEGFRKLGSDTSGAGASALNHPANLSGIGLFLATLLGMDEQQLSKTCGGNTGRLFQLPGTG